MTDERKVVHHQIRNMDPSRGYGGRPVVSADSLSELDTEKVRHVPGKWVVTLSSRRRSEGTERQYLGQGIVERAPTEGIMVDKEPMVPIRPIPKIYRPEDEEQPIQQNRGQSFFRDKMIVRRKDLI